MREEGRKESGMEECNRLKTCGFIRKWSTTKQLACKGFISMYCRGEKQALCKRKKYFKENGEPPPDDMLPNGVMMYVDPCSGE